MQDVNPLNLVKNPRNEPALVARDIEYYAASNPIYAAPYLFDILKMSPACVLCNLTPREQRGFPITMLGNSLTNLFRTDDSHEESSQIAKLKSSLVPSPLRPSQPSAVNLIIQGLWLERAMGIEPIANSLSPVESVGLTLLEDLIGAG